MILTRSEDVRLISRSIVSDKFSNLFLSYNFKKKTIERRFPDVFVENILWGHKAFELCYFKRIHRIKTIKIHTERFTGASEWFRRDLFFPSLPRVHSNWTAFTFAVEFTVIIWTNCRCKGNHFESFAEYFFAYEFYFRPSCLFLNKAMRFFIKLKT